MFKKTPLATAIGSITFAGAMAAVSVPAIAEDDMIALEEVVVTGSRIRRADFSSNAPVATVDMEQIDLTGTVNTESLLNTMPQMVPGLDRTSNNPGNGTATVDLRGLGSNRTLVLLNGTRAVPTTQGGSVDINNIPTALIERIEVLTGGASAVYGTDAVAGVVNFILDDNFEGVEFNVSSEQTEAGDAALTSIDMTVGANTGDGRGNVVLNMSWTDREDLFQGDRDFAATALFDDGAGGLEPGGSSGVPATAIFGGFSAFSPSGAIIFEPNGDIRPFVTGGQVNDFYNYAPVNYIQLPQTRYQATSLARYEFSDNLEAYGRATYTFSRVPQQLAPTPIFQTSTFTLDGSPFITPAAQQIISDAIGDGVDADGNGIDDTATALVRRRLEEVGPRISDDQFNSFQLKGGIRGDIGDTSWSYDAYIQTGRVTSSLTQNGNVNRDRFNQALLLDLSDPTGNTCADPGANGATSACAPIQIFGEGNISPAGAAFLNTAVASSGEYEQDVYSLTFAGDLMELPGGIMSAAFGYELVDQAADFRPSQDLAAGTIAGFNGSPASGGFFRFDSYFGELFVPILSGAPLAEELSLDLAYRSSDYSTSGTIDSYKIAGSWALNDTVRFRGGFNQAVRAPAISELFSPQGEGFPSAEDPCSENGNPDAATAAICTATGVPASAVGTAAINAISGQTRGLFGGNPNLTPETADTFTAGVVLSEIVPGLTMSLDYFDIEIEDYITSFGGSVANVLQVCYDPSDSLGGVGSPFCNAINRRGDGSIETVEVTLQNAATQTLNGWDLLVRYQTDFMGGNLDINYVGTFTSESDFTPFQGGQVVECAGQFGNLCGEPLPDYKHRTTFNWSRDKITAQLLWRLVGSSDDDDPNTDYTVETIDAENYFDIVASYAFTENYKVTFGIDNIADTAPPVLGANDEQANTWPATYDVFGRTYYLKASAKF